MLVRRKLFHDRDTARVTRAIPGNRGIWTASRMNSGLDDSHEASAGTVHLYRASFLVRGERHPGRSASTIRYLVSLLHQLHHVL